MSVTADETQQKIKYEQEKFTVIDPKTFLTKHELVVLLDVKLERILERVQKMFGGKNDN